jgi:amidase
LGVSPIEPDVRAVCAAAAERLAGLGVSVEDACPDLRDAPETFQVLRAAAFVASLGPLYQSHRDLLKPDIVWNIEAGLRLTAEEIGQAERTRGAIYRRIAAFFTQYDLLLCPAACVPPFDVGTRWIRELDGVSFDNYVEWLRVTSAITLTSCPAISLPAGFTPDGRPVGLQLVGKPHGEAGLLAAAAALEDALGLAGSTPIDPRSGNFSAPSEVEGA